MTDLATIGFRVDTSGLKTGTVDVEQFGSRVKAAAAGIAQSAEATKTANTATGVYAKAVNGAANAHAGFSTQGMAAFHAVRSMAEGMAMGMPPTQMLAGQMNHLSYAASGPGGLTGAFSEVVSMLVGMMTPMRLLAFGGFAALGAAAYSFYEIVNRDERTLEQSLEEHARLLGIVKNAYNDLSQAAGKFYDQSKAQTLLLAQQNLLELQSKIKNGISSALRSVDVTDYIDTMGGYSGMKLYDLPAKLAPFRQAFDVLNDTTLSGTDSVRQYRDAIAAIGNENPALRTQAAILLRESQALGDLAINASKAEAMIRLLTGSASEADKKMLGVATVAASNAFTSLRQRTRDEIEELNLEAQSAGRSSVEIDKLRRLHEFLRAAKDAHIGVSGKLRQKIDEEAEAYARAKHAALEARIGGDLQFDRDTMFMSPSEKAAANAAKQLYGPAWQKHLNDSIPRMAALNAQLNQAKELSGDFLNNWAQALLQGKNGAEALQSALLSLESQLIQMASKQLINQIFGALFPGSGGGGGGIFGFLGSLFGSANGNIFDHGYAVNAFADGGIVGGPTAFPMPNGLGMMGEAGPEAIMPLKKGPDGKLGVFSHGGGTQKVEININLAGANGDATIKEMVNQGVAQGMQQVLRQVPAIAVRSVAQTQSTRPGILGKS